MWLYLIEILHQTTTASVASSRKLRLYLIEILHQTTTSLSPPSAFVSCILSKFYIKPQRSTGIYAAEGSCILSKFYIKPQLKVIHRLQSRVVSYRNSTSNHNYPSSWWKSSLLYLIEILHQTTTLAYVFYTVSCCILSKFYIKPQQYSLYFRKPRSCILSKFYIKPQRRPIKLRICRCCILSKFYIKPQLHTAN